MFTRTDWPETGLPAAITDEGPAAARPDWQHDTRVGSIALRWLATTDGFESDLYRLPVVSARVEMEAPDAASLVGAGKTAGDEFHRWVAGLVGTVPWPECYLLAKVVRGEILHGALVASGFEEVERRSLYRTCVGDLVAPSSDSRELRFTTMADVEPEARGRCRDEMMEICAEAFEHGHSRHFSDPFLLARAPGLEYLRGAMQLNFDHVVPGFQLLVFDPARERLCGFSFVGTRRGLPAETFTQLLTGVRREYQGRGVYQGFTSLLKRTLPRDGVLVNATHADNAAMEAAYRRSGRSHLADTVVLRRVFHQPGKPS
jgi:hypothetical protein